jgi:hypothetical protein
MDRPKGVLIYWRDSGRVTITKVSQIVKVKGSIAVMLFGIMIDFSFVQH